MSGRPLGTVPADQALYAGALLIFGGRRWKVTAVDHAQKIIEVTAAAGGRLPGMLLIVSSHPLHRAVPLRFLSCPGTRPRRGGRRHGYELSAWCRGGPRPAPSGGG
jgi:hypothetical protein